MLELPEHCRHVLNLDVGFPLRLPDLLVGFPLVLSLLSRILELPVGLVSWQRVHHCVTVVELELILGEETLQLLEPALEPSARIDIEVVVVRVFVVIGALEDPLSLLLEDLLAPANAGFAEHSFLPFQLLVGCFKLFNVLPLDIDQGVLVSPLCLLILEPSSIGCLSLGELVVFLGLLLSVVGKDQLI